METNKVVRIKEQAHTQLKVKSAVAGLSMKEYLENFLNKDTSK